MDTIDCNFLRLHFGARRATGYYHFQPGCVAHRAEH